MFTLKASISEKPASRKLETVSTSYLYGDDRLLIRMRDLQGNSETQNCVTAQNLNCPRAHIDFGPSQIGALEALDVARTSDLGPLKLRGVDN